MNFRKNNNLIVIEKGRLTTYALDDKLVWTVGRPSKDNDPDIKLHSLTVSRKHGKFENIDGIWFYLDEYGKNGTVYNKKRLVKNKNGKKKLITLKDGDIFVFGGGEQEIINSKTIWAMYTEKAIDEFWQVNDTKGYEKIVVYNAHKEIEFHKPDKGLVVSMEDGIAIYMEDITYVSGNIKVTGC